MEKKSFIDELFDELGEFVVEMGRTLRPIRRNMFKNITSIEKFIEFLNKNITRQSDIDKNIDYIKQEFLSVFESEKMIGELNNVDPEFDSEEFVLNSRNNYEKIVEFVNSTDFIKFVKSPASTKYHGAKIGGLLIHSLRVYQCALKIAPNFDLSLIEVDPISCVFHDACKIGAYNIYENVKENGIKMPLKITYSSNADSIQHGPESIIRIMNYGFKIRKEWRVAIAYHMGAFIESDARAFGDACENHPEVLLLHTADMMASKLFKE